MDGIPWPFLLQAWRRYFREFSRWRKEAGRDPNSLKMVVRANLLLSDKPLAKDRAVFSGTFDQVKEDIAACREAGAHELFFDPTFTPGAQELPKWLAIMEQVRKLD